MSFKNLLRKGSSGDQKGRPAPAEAARGPAPERHDSARPVPVLYLGDARETRLMSGAFSYDHPQLALDFCANLQEATARLTEPGRYEALVIGWSVPESEAAALISHLRAKEYPLAIVAVGERALEVLREAGADQCVPKGASLLARLPVAIEEAVKNRTGSVDAAAVNPAGEPAKDAHGDDPTSQPATATQELATLRIKESRLRALVDRLPACVVRVSPQGLILATNSVALSLLGAAQPNQLLRKPFDELVSEGERSTWKEFVSRVCAGEQRSCEVSMTALDGVSRAIEAAGVPSPAEGGQSNSALLVLRDVSDRRRLEVSLEEAIRRAAPLDVLDPPAHTPAPAAATAPDPAPDTHALRHLEADLNHLAGRARTSLDEFGALLRDVAAQHDASFTRQADAYARVKAEQLEHWRSYESFVQSAANGVVRVSLENTFQSVNQAFASMLGYGSPEALTGAVSSVGELTDQSKWTRAVERWRHGSVEPVESHWRRRDGGVAAIRLRGRVVAAPGGDGEYVEVLGEDVGAQRALEAQLRRARRWEDAARVTSGIAADLTHLVASIRDAADRVLRESMPDGAAREHAEALHQAVSRASALSRQLVAFGRKEARDPHAFDFNDAVRSLEGVVRRLVDEHIEIALALEPSLGTVEASEPALEEAVVQLVVAAGSALPAGGRIDITTAARDVGQSEGEAPEGVTPGAYAVLSITASGWGLDAEIQDRLSGVVTGIAADEVSKGLTSARRSVGRMGGHVSVEGVPGTSLTFNLYVPRVHGTNEFESEELGHEVDVISPSVESAPGTDRVEM